MKRLRRAAPWHEASFWAYHGGLAILALTLNAIACALAGHGPILMYSPVYALGVGIFITYPAFDHWWRNR